MTLTTLLALAGVGQGPALAIYLLWLEAKGKLA